MLLSFTNYSTVLGVALLQNPEGAFQPPPEGPDVSDAPLSGDETGELEDKPKLEMY